LAFKTLQLLTSGKLYMAQQTINWENKTVTLQIVPSAISREQTVNALISINKIQ
jgi:hypothetical protein